MPPQINALNDFSQNALGELKSWFEQVGLVLPISQMTGFKQFVAQQSQVVANETTTTINAYTDLTTVGPQFTNDTALPNGRYLFIFGGLFGAGGAGGDTGKMALSINGSTPDDNEAAWTPANNTDPLINGSRATVATLSAADKNTVKLQYKCTVSGSGWAKRWLVAIRYA